MAIDKANVLRQIDDVLALFDKVAKRCRRYTAGSSETYLDVPLNEASELFTLMRHTIERFRPSETGAFGKEAVTGIAAPTYSGTSNPLESLCGLLRALRAEYDADRLQSFRELVHADVFADFLEMADHLLEQNYKDAAAVMTGGVLEEHLRKLCGRHSIPGTNTDRAGKVHPKMTDAMNTDLAKGGVYGNIERQSVAAWAAIRNAAAHGDYTIYTAE